MSTSRAQGLTEEELILHHHAAMVKKDTEAYQGYLRSEEDWVYLFRHHLVCFYSFTAASMGHP